MEIDAVYTWVDLSDPKWSKKYQIKTGNPPKLERFKDYGELEFSVKLLIKNCEFIRYIFIVTDEQIPKWYDAEKYPKIKIIDHSQILGPECSKPTFKSDSIESYFHNIPDLSEYFLYLNDDTFIGRKCTIDTFIDKKTQLPIVRLKSTSLNNNIKQSILNGTNNFVRGISLINAMDCIKKKYGIHMNVKTIHQVSILRKSMYELAWKLFPQEISRSVKYPTRKPRNDTISVVFLSMILGIVNKNMKAEIDKYSIKIYLNYSFKNGGFLNNLNRVMFMKPHLFCINDIDDSNIRYFNAFKNKYLR